MTNITLDPAKAKVAAVIKSASLHYIGVEITVIAKNGAILEKHQGTIGSGSSQVVIPLDNPPSAYNGCGIQATCAFRSPDGSDTNPYSASYSLMTDGSIVAPSISFQGSTNGGTATASKTFLVKS